MHCMMGKLVANARFCELLAAEHELLLVVQIFLGEGNRQPLTSWHKLRLPVFRF